MLRTVGRLVARPIAKGAERAESLGFQKGRDGSGLWLALSVGLAAFRLIRRLGARKREVVWSGELLPGEVLKLDHLLEDRKGRPVTPKGS